ncbi:putative RNA-directed DNA polymerase from transposon X-element [Trichonephila clavipes]|nr:putative RNA-directed DNA polymerase from transposon X-element [Trichonephila clavipes]
MALQSDHMQQPVCYQDLKTSIHHYIHHIWQETWDQQILNKLHSIHPSTADWAAVPVRRHDVRLTGLRIGHTRLAHRHVLLGESPPVCGLSQCGLSILHILIECPTYSSKRSTFFKTNLLTLNDLVEETSHPNLFAFLYSIDVLHEI